MKTSASPDKPGLSTTRDPDADILDLVTRGELACATHELIKRHGAGIYRFCRIAVGNAALADDVHQQVFIDAFRDMPRFAGRSTMRTWLFAIARHRVLDAVRQRRRAAACIADVLPMEVPDPRPLPDESIDSRALHAALIASLDTLAAPIRTAILQHYQQGLTFEEMAGIYHEKACTLNARVARALPRLRTGIQSRLRVPRASHAITCAAV